MTSVSDQSTNLDWVDALRGLAILGVISVHVSLKFPDIPAVALTPFSFGQMGVQLFFMASAFTLSLSWEKTQARNKSNSKLEFFLRRVFRIAPCYYFGIILYFLLSIAESFVRLHSLYPNPDYNVINILANIFFLHGFIPPSNNTIVPGGWSIGTEFTFYGLFPFIIDRYLKFSSRNLAFSLLLPSLAFFSSFCVWTFFLLSNNERINNSFWYYNIITQIGCFLGGISLYSTMKMKSNPTFPRLATIIFVSSIALAICAFHYFQNQVLFLAVLPISTLAFASLAFLVRYGICNWSIIQYIGRLSFSIYIIHFSVIYFLGMALKMYFPLWRGNFFVFLICLLCVTSFSTLMASIIHRFIEINGINWGKKFISKLRVNN